MVVNVKDFIRPFQNIPYPRHDWCQAVADMEYEDIEAIKKKFQCPKYYEQISLDDMQHFHEMLFFIPNDKEKMYYFPTYIRYLLENPHKLEGIGLDYTFFTVLKDLDTSVLTKEQREALINFLTYIKQKNNIYNYDDDLLEEAIRNLKDKS